MLHLGLNSKLFNSVYIMLYRLLVVFQEFLKYLLSPIVASQGQLTEEPSSFEAGRLKSTITQWACAFDIGDCSQQAWKLYTQWSSTSNPDIENP